MDKFEYNLKIDQIKSLCSEGDYGAAAEIADTINWNKIRNANTLVKIGEVYEKAERLQEARDVLLTAYEKSPIGRTIIYHLAELSIQMEDYSAAQEYYEEFLEIAPNDNTRYPLHYLIRKGQGARLPELISILEEYRKVEYTSDQYAYELANLYSQAGQVDKCVEACNELILWFVDGEYVGKALELKQKYRPLNRAQQEKYQEILKKRNGYTDIDEEAMSRSGEVAHAPVTIPEVKVKAEKFNTVDLQEEIALGIQQIMNATEEGTVNTTLDNIKKIVEDLPDMKLPEEKPASIIEPAPSAGKVTAGLPYKTMIGEEADGQMSLITEERKAPEKQITGQISIQDLLDDWGRTVRKTEKDLKKAEKQSLEDARSKALRQAEDIMEQLTGKIPQMDLDETEEIEAITSETAVKAEAEEPEAEEAESEMPEAEEVFEEAEAEEAEATETEAPEMTEAEEAESEMPEAIEAQAFEEPEKDELPEIESDADELPEIDLGLISQIAANQNAVLEESKMEKQEPDAAGENITANIPAMMIPKNPLTLEESAIGNTKVFTGSGIPEDDDAIPTKVMEKIPGRYQQSEFDIDEVFKNRSAIDVTEEKSEEELQMEQQMTTRKPKRIGQLTSEMKSAFSYFVPIRGMESQLCDAINEVTDKLTSEQKVPGGNLIIAGEPGCGKTVLATSFIKVMQDHCGKPVGKIGKIDAAALIRKDIQQLFRKVAGGCLIIESAGKLDRNSAISLSYLIECDTTGVLVILEDTEEGINKARSLDDSFSRKFTAKITVPIFTNDELVSFARSYARELGYKIDDMAILALHKRISNIQRIDQATTLAEVKEIVDEAVERESHFGFAKYISLLTGRRYTKDDRILLPERCFTK